MAEFRLSQEGGEASLERQLRTKLENQPDYRTTRVDTTTDRGQEEEDDAYVSLEPDLAFMVNDGLRSIEEALRSRDRNQWIDAINNELELLESNEKSNIIKPRSLSTEARPISSRMILQEKVEEDRRIVRITNL